jgi:hypothetical protein
MLTRLGVESSNAEHAAKLLAQFDSGKFLIFCFF